MTESEVITLIRKSVLHSSDISRDFQDDCAALKLTSEQTLLLSSDLLIQDVHFRLDVISPEDLGYKSLAVSLSDLASKGAEPVGFLLSWSLPAATDGAWLESFLSGLDSGAREFECSLMGGDTTTSSGPISICITIIGRAVLDGKVSRQNAEAGDLLVVTGELGGSGIGLSLQEQELKADPLPAQFLEDCRRRHVRPSPRLREGRWLVENGIKAMMDLSDGVYRDVPKLALASNKGFHIEVTQLPLFEGAEALLGLGMAQNFALYGGEDYELLFSVRREEYDRLSKAFGESFDTPLNIIGRLTNNPEAHWLDLPKVLTGFPTLSFEHVFSS